METRKRNNIMLVFVILILSFLFILGVCCTTACGYESTTSSTSGSYTCPTSGSTPTTTTIPRRRRRYGPGTTVDLGGLLGGVVATGLDRAMRPDESRVTIIGIVYDEDSRAPIEGAKVTISAIGFEKDDLSDRQGKYRIAGCPVGQELTVECEKEGYGDPSLLGGRVFPRHISGRRGEKRPI